MKKTSSAQRTISKLLKTQKTEEQTSEVDSGMATRAKTELATKEKNEMEEIKNSVSELRKDIEAVNSKMMENINVKLMENMSNINAGNQKVIDCIGIIQKRIEDVHEELMGRINKGEEESKKKFEAVHVIVSSQVTAMKDMETVVDQMAEDMQGMKPELDSLKSQLVKVSGKGLDLEARSRRQNL